jgi:hypothetical protein
MIAALSMLMHALCIQNLAMNTVLVVVAMSINCGFAKDIQIGRVFSHLLWPPITANMMVQANHLICG